MNELAALWLTVMALCAIALVRNELVFRARIRRIHEISALCKQDIGRSDFTERLERRYAELDSQSYEAMVLDLRRWTYSQFYPQEVA